MKNCLLLLLAMIIITPCIHAQDKSGIVATPVIYIGSASNTDHLPKSELLSIEGPTVKAGNTKFAVYEFTLSTSVKGNPVELYSNSSRFTEEMKEAFKDITNGTTLSVKAKVKQPQGVMRFMTISVTIGPKPGNSKFNFSAKLLKGDKKLEAIPSQEVVLKDELGAELKKAITDQFGDFTFTELSADQQYHLEINITVSITGKVFLARPNGTVITELPKNESGIFTYKLLPKEHIELQQMEAEDPMLKVLDLNTGSKSEVTVAENILYASGSYELSLPSMMKLDKVVRLMKDDSLLVVELISHTDSKGNDAVNMKLSQSRASTAVDYIVSKGINKSRISGQGKGETQLLNRCSNDVQCSEEEHRLNRRTEFRFTKKK